MRTTAVCDHPTNHGSRPSELRAVVREGFQVLLPPCRVVPVARALLPSLHETAEQSAARTSPVVTPHSSRPGCFHLRGPLHFAAWPPRCRTGMPGAEQQ